MNKLFKLMSYTKNFSFKIFLLVIIVVKSTSSFCASDLEEDLWAAGGYRYETLTSRLFENLSEIDRYYVRKHDKSPAKKKYEVYEKYFNDKEAISEIDITDLSRRARVIFFSLCLNKNIDFLYGTLLANGKLIDEKIPDAKELEDKFFEIQLKKKFKADSSFFSTTYYGQKWICCKFGRLLVTIIPKPTKNQHGNALFIFNSGLPTQYTTLDKKGLVDFFEEEHKAKALEILKQGNKFPVKLSYLKEGSQFGDDYKPGYRDRLNALSLLFEFEISRRYITRRGERDEALYNLPFASVISMATDLGELVKCFTGSADSRKDALRTILSKYLKKNLVGLLGGADESDAD